MGRGGNKPPDGGSDDAKRLWPAMSVELRPLGQIRINDENPRTHTLEQIELISRSMDEFGWTIPMLIDDEGTLLAGHGRYRAARLKGWTEGPVIIARGWSEAQKRAYLVADNRLAERSDWDKSALRGTLQSLRAADFEMGLIGFSSEDLNKMLLEPASLESPDPNKPTEVTMKVCPACGRMSRKMADE